MPTKEVARFFDATPVFEQFGDAVDDSSYQALPNGWFVAVSDVVNSTDALRDGRYKAVNLVGASAISAVMNALDRVPFPFVFGGDGAAIAIPSSLARKVEEALARVRTWSQEAMSLQLRVAMVPIEDIRACGHDVRIARLRVAPNVCPELCYAMFSGGGVQWAEHEMKQGRYAIDAAAPGAQPDLVGLSCRWNPIKARNGEVASLLVMPTSDADPEKFADLARAIVDLLDNEILRGGHPVPEEGPQFAIGTEGLRLEASCDRKGGPSPWKRFKLRLFSIFAWALFKTNFKFGRFDPATYRRDSTSNTDFRKIDDGLKLTVDCSPQTIAQLESLLEAAYASGLANYGLHRQDAALMTCIVPSALTRDHMHFVDGAGGGYAMAAEKLKAKLRD